MEKTPDGKSIRYTIYDIEALWYMGFVDTTQYSLDDWKVVFEDHKQSDGTYLLDKNSFLTLETYRYKGELHIPFDAMQINEGFYTDEGLRELIELSIRPSCSVPEREFDKFFEDLKNQFRSEDNLIKIEREAKLKIKGLIEKNPSPLRNLEIMFDRMITDGTKEKMEKQIAGSEAEIATARAAIESSEFVKTPTKFHSSAINLKNIQKSRKQNEVVADDKSVVLKKIKRSRKGVRG